LRAERVTLRPFVNVTVFVFGRVFCVLDVFFRDDGWRRWSLSFLQSLGSDEVSLRTSGNVNITKMEQLLDSSQEPRVERVFGFHTTE
jgi:hypothetical protein